jgi:thiol-disulfide isomerase/thioredoxin
VGYQKKKKQDRRQFWGKIGALGLVFFVCALCVQALFMQKTGPERPFWGQELPVLSETFIPAGPVVVHIWNPWCPVCATEQGAWKKYAEDSPSPVVGVVFRSSHQEVEDFFRAQDQGSPYSDLWIDTEGQALIEWGLQGLPHTFVLDKKGHVCYSHMGAVTQEQWDNDIRPLLGGK